jgi:molybdate transport system substrate-binding protein
MANVRRFLCAALLISGVTAAFAADVQVMSAGALEAGLTTVLQQYKRATDTPLTDVQIQFASGAQIARSLAEGIVADVLIAPAAVVDQAIRDRLVYPETKWSIGRVGVGVTVRADARNPNIATAEALKQAVMNADAIIYSQGSSGVYVEKLFDQMGLAALLQTKGQRYVNGADVVERIISGKGNEIGFGAITEIRMYETKGAKLVGPLPAAVQNYTTYVAVEMIAAPSPEAAIDFLHYLASPVAKRLFAATGVEQ